MVTWGLRLRRRNVVVGAVIALIVTSTGWWVVSRATPTEESCPSTSLAELRVIAAKADRAVEGTVLRRVDLSDGETQSSGFQVQVVRNLLGTSPTTTLTVWQPLDVPELREGKLVLFLVGHPRTTAAGKAVDGYDTTPDSGAIFAVEGPSLRRVCRSGLGPTIDRKVLDAVAG